MPKYLSKNVKSATNICQKMVLNKLVNIAKMTIILIVCLQTQKYAKDARN